jgi:hypothetical protein
MAVSEVDGPAMAGSFSRHNVLELGCKRKLLSQGAEARKQISDARNARLP